MRVRSILASLAPEAGGLALLPARYDEDKDNLKGRSEQEHERFPKSRIFSCSSSLATKSRDLHASGACARCLFILALG